MSNLPTVDIASRIIDDIKADVSPMLAEANQSFDRLRATFIIAVQQNPEILNCSTDSIRREISKCAADGLVPDSKEAALIPYKGVVQYQPMVHGIIKRMRELGGVFQITCKLVYEKDHFEYDDSDPDSLVHRSDHFATDRGAIRGGYVIFRDEHKRVMHLETMSADDFERVRKASKAPDSPAWRNWREEMCRKAVLRRGAKFISINNDKIRSLIERQDEMFDFRQPQQVERVDPFSGSASLEASRQPSAALAYQSQPSVSVAASEREIERVEVKPSDHPAPKTEAVKRQKFLEEAPSVPDVMSEDNAETLKAAESFAKILAIANEHDSTPEERRSILKMASPEHKAALPEHLHEALRTVIAMTDWCIQRESAGMTWSADHAAFAQKLATRLDVDKFDVGKYK